MIVCDNRRFCEVMSATAVSGPESSISQGSPAPSSTSSVSPFPLLRFSLSLAEVDANLPCGAEHSAISCSQLFGQLCGSALTVAHCEKKLLWPRLREALMYGYKHKYVKGRLGTSPFSKAAVVGYTLEPMTSPAMDFGSSLWLPNLHFLL